MQPADRYKVILVICTGLLLFYVWKEHNYFLYSALTIGVLSLLFSLFAKYVNLAWFKLAELLGWINSRILLSIIFFFILTPIALLRKLLTVKKAENPTTYYETRNHLFQKRDMENTW